MVDILENIRGQPLERQVHPKPVVQGQAHEGRVCPRPRHSCRSAQQRRKTRAVRPTWARNRHFPICRRNDQGRISKSRRAMASQFLPLSKVIPDAAATSRTAFGGCARDSCKVQ